MQEIVKKRIKFLIIAILVGFPFIAFRLYYIQVIEHESFAESAAKNLDRYKDVPPRRAAIYDRFGELLVKTAPSYNILFRIEGMLTSPYTAKETLNYDPLYALVEFLKPYDDTVEFEPLQAEVEKRYAQAQKNIADKMESLKKKLSQEPRKVLQKQNEFKKDYYRRTHVLVKKVPPEAACLLYCSKSRWMPSPSPTPGTQQAVCKDLYAPFFLDVVVDRTYLKPGFAPQLLGMVNKIPERLQASLIPYQDYQQNDLIGIDGLEKIFEKRLKGKRGTKVDSRTGDDFLENSIDGKDLYLTLDAGAQEIAEKSLDQMLTKYEKCGAIGGAAVVISIQTGDILVLATSPRYDNTDMNYNELKEDEAAAPLRNRAIRYGRPTPPGSTFKVFVALYALAANVINEGTTFTCHQYMHVPGKFKCTHHHGPIQLVRAIEGSCNVYFYHVGELLGPERLEHCARLFGYGELSGLGFYGKEEVRGFLPTPEAKEKQGAGKWSSGDSRMFGIGQLMEATPIQVARAMAMLALQGSMPQLQIHLEPEERKAANMIPVALHEQTQDGRFFQNLPSVTVLYQWPIQQKHWRLVKEGMRLVTEGKDGTAKGLKLAKGLRIASKTGTAQVAGHDPKTGRRYPDHAWFAGFAPLDNPRYAFAVFIEHGGYGGTTAAPVAVDILNYLWEKEKGER